MPLMRRSPRMAVVLWLAIGGTALVVGVLTGRAIAYVASLGGFNSISAAILTVLLVSAVLGLGLIALIATKLRQGDVSRAITMVLAAAGLLATGALGGHATAAAFGGTFRAPVVLEAPGEANVRLDRGMSSFVASGASAAECRSVADETNVAEVTALDLGELGSGTLRATVSLSASMPRAARAEFWIDGGDLPEGADQPFWSGSALLIELSADRSQGRLVFDGLPRAVEQGGAPGAWPRALSGEMTWSCLPW